MREAMAVGQVSLEAYRGAYDREELRRRTIEYLAEHSNASEKMLSRALRARIERVHACLCSLKRNLEVDDFEKDGETCWHYVVDLSRAPPRSYIDTAGANHAAVKESLKRYEGNTTKRNRKTKGKR
jgi:hypothetical protein